MNLQMQTLAQLKAMGAKSASLNHACDVLSVEFFPATEPIDNSPSLPRHLDLGGPEMCACSHDETEHAGGFCLLGCRDEMCNPPKSDAQKTPDAP